MTYDPLSPGAIAYMQIAREIAERGRVKETEPIDEEFNSPFNSNVVNINYKGGIA
jgi:hypothetical protein